MNRTLPAVRVGRSSAQHADPVLLRVLSSTGPGGRTSVLLTERHPATTDSRAGKVTGCYDEARGYVRAVLTTAAGTLTLRHETGRFSGVLPAELLGTLRLDPGWSPSEVRRATTRAADGIVLVDLWGDPGDGLVGTIVGHALGGLTGTGGGAVTWEPS
ncbi:hypothetical protein Sked_30740 [Sanguibacter keddieii DSM 10542]|uniref:Uncharacterized protein n=1 Tax=Sanguibacter keddieii (strain ATCC 51767 / DSM 10542 / NCFB 3025 / ST-74) TaxID=446469 RepID=D1BCI5_SANKS|nr:hypothetical protein [Sanguibacter keddieii]ACZ22972.1 hypothetical protein Sked_30740 [Sanguibacter keddieii DSM 10542]